MAMGFGLERITSISRREFLRDALLWSGAMMLPGCATQEIPKKQYDQIFPGQRVKFDQIDFSSLPNAIPFPGNVLVAIRDKQVAGFYQNGTLVRKMITSTGMPGHETTPGVHKIFRRAETYQSKTYNAPMPKMQMFTQDGQSIHESPNVGKRIVRAEDGEKKEEMVINRAFNSHGCLGFSEEDARFLWEHMGMGDVVIVQ